MSENLLEEIERRLKAKTIHDLRQVARAVGVPRPADGKKERILEYIMQIASGTGSPVAPAVRGAHPKSDEYDRQLVADIVRCREICLSGGENVLSAAVGSGAGDEGEESSAEGIFDADKDRYYICGTGDVSVSPQFVERYKLRTGDFISGKCRRENGEDRLALIYSVNGVSPETLSERVRFDELSYEFPDERLKIFTEENGVTGKMLDVLSPVGKGQRAVVIGKHGTGKSVLLKLIAKGIGANRPDVKVIFAAVDASPEETADLRRTFEGNDVFTSSFDAGASAHIRTVRLSLEYAKRQVETGKDVLLVLDDLSGLTRAYNSGQFVSGELSTYALDSAKKFLACAKNSAEGGSLTIFTALDPDGVFTDGAAYSGLKDICNLHISLSAELAKRRVFPAIDIGETYSLGCERFLTEEELKTASELRGKTYAEAVEAIKNF